MNNDMNRTKEYSIDERSEADFVARMHHLAASYTPEWNFDDQNPDIAATLAILYGKQLSENVDRINQSIDRYHTSFINLLDINARPAKPAASTVVMELSQDTLTGVQVPRGTKLFCGSIAEDDENASIKEDINGIVFETIDDLYVTRSRIASVFLTDYENGTIFPAFGAIEEPLILNSIKRYNESDEEFTMPLNEQTGQNGAEEEEQTMKPFALFGPLDGLHNNLCLIYHPYVLDCPGDSILISLMGNDELIHMIQRGDIVFEYPFHDQMIPIESVELLEDGCTYRLKKKYRGDLQDIYGTSLDVIALKAECKLKTDLEVEGIRLSAKGALRPADYVGTNEMQLKEKAFPPFSERISTYTACYIACEDCLNKPGAVVTLDFDLSFQDHMERITAEQKEAALKIIRKRPRADANLNPADVYVNRIAIEYFNGRGFKLLEMDHDYSRIFEDDKARHVTMRFVCPSDMEIYQSGSYEGLMLRFSVMQAVNCFMLPSLHHYPVITDLKMGFDYVDKQMKPELVSVISGADRINIRHEIMQGTPYAALMANRYTQDALYIGFDEKPEEGPIGLLFLLKEEERYDNLPLLFEYSTAKGFQPLKVLDGTEQMSHTGNIYFVPPADFHALTLEGADRHWIRVRRGRNGLEHEILPVIKDIIVNSVRVANIDTKEEINLFIDEIEPDTSFSLPFQNILNLDVWVNETASLPKTKMEELINQDKDHVRIERDIQGNIVALYVKWQEVEQFDSQSPKRSYVVDRLSSQLIFGDGIHTDIPRCLDDIAVRVTARCSLGRIGNVEAGTINSIQMASPYLGDVYNPIKAFGGSSMETLDLTLERGANMIATRNRLISKKDFIIEIKAFSDLIDQVQVIKNRRPDNSAEDGAMTFCILMKDFETGPHSFHRVSKALKDYLMSHCEMTVDPTMLYIAEPVFVELSVVIWASDINLEDTFYLQHYLNEIMADYLNPLEGKGGNFRMGQIPTEDQIRLRLNYLKNKLVIRSITILAKYTDEHGVHEVSLNDLKVTPFMIVKNGTHRIK